MAENSLNIIERDDLIEIVRALIKKVRELEAEILRIRKLLQAP